MENLMNIQNNLKLEQSELFKDLYKRVGNANSTETFNEISINDIESWYNSLLVKYDFNNRQIINLQSFFKSLKKVLTTINPDALKIKNELTDETDLLLWRESVIGISKLIFDEYGDITYMFNGNDGRKIRGDFDNTVDMESLLYRFLSM